MPVVFIYIGVGNIGEMCQLEGFCAPGNVHFVMYIFVLDICCQHLGNIRQLKGFCAPFGCKVKECVSKFVLDICCQNLEIICQ